MDLIESAIKAILGQAGVGANPKRVIDDLRERHKWRRANQMLGALEIPTDLSVTVLRTEKGGGEF